MEFKSRVFIDIVSNKTCFLCLKVCPEMMDVTEVLEIRQPSSIISIKVSEIVQYLFPAFDIICTQTCRLCSDLLIKMYVTIYKNNYIRNILTTMTKYCNTIIDNTNTENQVTLDIKLSNGKDKPERKVVIDKLCSVQKIESYSCPNVSNIDPGPIYKHKRKKKFYVCDHCSYRSVCKGTLEGHINKFHARTRPFVCEVCLKSFYRKSNLTEHKQTHNKVSVCEICGDQFARKQTLINHLKLHTNDRAYKCMLCDKSFINSGRRLDHMKRKHLDKNECCVFCDKRFGMKKELIRHVKSVHS